MVGQRLLETKTEVPAMGKVEVGGFHELPLGAQPLEEQDELQAKEDDRVNTRPAALSVLVSDPVAHKAEVELGVQLTIEVVSGEPLFERAEKQLVAAED